MIPQPQTLVALCKDCQLPNSRDTQGSQESQQAVGELVKCVDSTELSSTDSESSYTDTSMINTPEKKKGFSIWESYQKAVKKLKPTSLYHSLSFQEKISAMINDYINEPVTENPKNSWKNNKERYPVLAEVAKKVFVCTTKFSSYRILV